MFDGEGGGWKLAEIVLFGIAALWGGLVHTLFKARRGKKGFSTIVLIQDLAISGFAGLLVYWVCASAEFSFPVTGLLVGIAGHMGSRSIFIIQQYAYKNFFSKLAGVAEKPAPSFGDTVPTTDNGQIFQRAHAMTRAKLKASPNAKYRDVFYKNEKKLHAEKKMAEGRD